MERLPWFPQCTARNFYGDRCWMWLDHDGCHVANWEEFATPKRLHPRRLP